MGWIAHSWLSNWTYPFPQCRLWQEPQPKQLSSSSYWCQCRLMLQNNKMSKCKKRPQFIFQIFLFTFWAWPILAPYQLSIITMYFPMVLQFECHSWRDCCDGDDEYKSKILNILLHMQWHIGTETVISSLPTNESIYQRFEELWLMLYQHWRISVMERSIYV